MPRPTETAAPTDVVELPPKRRPRTIAFTVIALVSLAAVFGGGWSLATAFQSPAQQAAAATAPMPGAVTATVDHGSLEQTVGVTATVARQTQQQITMQSDSSPAIITKQPLGSGDQINASKVIAEVNGRPVFAVAGAFPFYRDLSPGDTGPDVRQLQEALKSAGYNVKPDGTFGAATVVAVRAMYKSAGYAVAVSELSSSATAPQSAAGIAVTSPAPGTGLAVPSVIVIPKSELITFATLPAFVVSTPVVGTVLDAKSHIVAEAGDIVATAAVASDVALRLKTGMTGILTGPDGQQSPITVESVGGAEPSSATTQDGSAPVDGAGQDTARGGVVTGDSGQSDNSSVVLHSVGNLFPATWLRSTVQAVITVQIASKTSLIVPSIAVISDGKDSAHVLKRLSDGSFTSVPVKETAALSGRSAITPQKQDDLVAGDTVRVN